MISILISLFAHGQINPLLLLIIVLLELLLIVLRIILALVSLAKIVARLGERIAASDQFQPVIERVCKLLSFDLIDHLRAQQVPQTLHHRSKSMQEAGATMRHASSS